jgi:hypothetical protein
VLEIPTSWESKNNIKYPNSLTPRLDILHNGREPCGSHSLMGIRWFLLHLLVTLVLPLEFLAHYADAAMLGPAICGV